MRILKVERIATPPMGESIDLQQLVGQHLVERHVAQTATALTHGLGLGQRRAPQR
jgi:hypothetical protein